MRAATEILADGGNAFDAALAALAAACVAEPVLASLGGGGFLMARAAGAPPVLYDFFADTPGRSRPAEALDFRPVLADFGTAQQEFHIGLGAIAVPAVVRGIFAVHRDLCRLPPARLFRPAAALARRGVRVNAFQAHLFRVVGPILVSTEASRALFTREDGELLDEGDLFRPADLADTLDALAREGEDLFYRGEIGRRLVDDCRTGGGLVTAGDLARVAAVRRRPLAVAHGDARLFLNPPPSSGGLLIAISLELLRGRDLGRFGSPAHLLTLAAAMAETDRIRREARLHERHGAALADEVLDPDFLAAYRRTVEAHAPATRGTTHISVVDGEGNAAGLSVSNGEGGGYLVPGTGIIMNNLLGEEDLNPAGFHRWRPATRLSSMMAPTLVDLADGGRAVLGTGGSNRIRSAVLQVLLNLLDFGLPADEAVARPRIHYEAGLLNAEGDFDEAARAALAAAYPAHRFWPEPSLFFGGVHTVVADGTGRIAAAADPRRGGVATVAE